FRERFTELVSRSGGDTDLRSIEVGRIVLEAARICGDCGIHVPRQLAMLGKTLLDLDHVGRMLDPRFDPDASIRRNAAQIMRRRILKSASPGRVFETFLEMKELAVKLPR